jgi:hypothetical protein
MKTKLFLLIMSSVMLLALSNYKPVNAPDGVEIRSGNLVKWSDEDGTKGYLSSDRDKSAVWKFGNKAAGIYVKPGDQDSQHIGLCAYSNNHCLTIYQDRLAVDGFLHVSGNINTDFDVNATGKVTGANLSGTNTGDQVVQSMLVTSLMGYSVPANSTAYTGPGLSGVTGAATNARVSMTMTGTINKITTCISAPQPSTGDLRISVFINGTVRSFYSIAASSSNGCYTSNLPIEINPNSRVYVRLENLATSSSAGISAITFNVVSQ